MILSLNVEEEARKYFEMIKEQITNFSDHLDAEHETLVMVAGFPHFQARCIYYDKPDVIVFIGEAHGGKTEIMQHAANVSVKISEVPRRPNKEKKPIFFGVLEEK